MSADITREYRVRICTQLTNNTNGTYQGQCGQLENVREMIRIRLDEMDKSEGGAQARHQHETMITYRCAASTHAKC